MENFYVYRWFICQTNKTFYIGKGSKNRHKQLRKRNKIFLNIILNNECDVEILYNFENECKALEKEKELIIKHKSLGECEANLDDGGTGGVNFTWTDKMRKYKSENNPMKDEHQRKRMSENNPMKNPLIAIKATRSKCKKIFIGDIPFNSLVEASKYFNKTSQTICLWLKRGHTPDYKPCRYDGKEQISFYKNEKCPFSKEVIYDNVVYESQKALAKKLNVNETNISLWIKKGFTTEGIPIRRVNDNREYTFKLNNHKHNMKSVIINNVKYESVEEASRQIKISTNTLHSWLSGKKVNINYDCKYDNQQRS